MITDEELTLFIEDFKKNPTDGQLEFYFKKIKPMFKLNEFKDPSGILEPSDIESFALEGFWIAVKKFNKNRWEKSLTWVCYLVRQKILREIKREGRRGKLSINSHMDPNLNMNVLSIKTDYDQSTQVHEKFVTDVNRLHLELYFINPKAAQIFQLRLAFPYMSRTSIAKILQFKKRSGVAKLVKIVRKSSKNQNIGLHKEILDYLFNIE